MNYKCVTKTDSTNVKRFVGTYNIPDDNKIINILYRFNGGKPDSMWFKIKRYGVVENVAVDFLLSFNEEDKSNIFEINNMLGISVFSDFVAFAVDDDENYIGFLSDENEVRLALYDTSEDDFFDILDEKEEKYGISTFFDDLDG